MILAEPALLVLIGTVAFLYSSVGHAGASGYIAALTLAGWAPAQVRPLALVLNVLVAAIATVKFYRAGYFRKALFVPVAVLSVPAAAVGGYIQLPALALSRLIGIALCLSVVWLLIGKREPDVITPPRLWVAIVTGGAIGLLAGLSGTGGGIFLSPLMLYLRWGKLKEISAIAAPYIFLNSMAGLVGLHLSGCSIPSGWFLYVAVAFLGGSVGSSVGAAILNAQVIQFLLAMVLSIAGAKLLFLS